MTVSYSPVECMPHSNELKTLPLHVKERIVLMHYGDNWRDFEQEALDEGFHSWARRATYNFPVCSKAKQS